MLSTFKPCENEKASHDACLAFAGTLTESDFWSDQKQLEGTVAAARQMLAMYHKVLFTHGDLLPYNVLISDGRISGIVD